MKTKILLFVFALALAFLPETAAAKQKEHLPFAPKGKYGKLRTKQAKPHGRKEAWIYRQWSRN
jgi:hypothetical protein